MKTNSIIYWITTGILGLVMLFSGYSYLTNPELEIAFKTLGFLDYFRVELAIAKIIGVVVLVIPQIPERIKEWAYAGFGIAFVSATIAHLHNNDAAAKVIAPLIFLVILIFSNIYMHKVSSVRYDNRIS